MANLRDAMDKTFMQMGEGAKGPIKDMVDGTPPTLWRTGEVSNVLGGVIGVMAVAKLATMHIAGRLDRKRQEVIANDGLKRKRRQ